MKQDKNSSDIDKILIESIHKLPYKKPPPGMAEKVLRSLAPKKLSWWRRFYIWFQTPKTFSFSPFALAPALAAMLILTFTISFYLKEITPPGLKPDGDKNLVPVFLTFRDKKAASVSVIGTFNHWSPKGYEMQYSKELGAWTLKLELAPGSHDYVFLIDKKTPLPDPQAEFTKEDGFGNRNSVLFVKNDYGRKI